MLGELTRPSGGDRLRLLAGDFNATLDHHELRRLLGDGGYVDAADAVGAGYDTTWPAGRDFPPEITIDHVLVDPRVRVQDVSVHPVATLRSPRGDRDARPAPRGARRLTWQVGPAAWCQDLDRWRGSSLPGTRCPPRRAPPCCATGGNAVDAAIAACLASWAAEPLLTGPGAGGYLLVAGAGRGADAAGLLRRRAVGRRRARRCCRSTSPSATRCRSSTSARRPAACRGRRPGLQEAARRWGTLPLADLAAPAAALAREGVALNAAQAYVFEILEGILLSTPEARRALRARGPRAARGRALPLARAGRHDRALRRRGRGAVLHRRPRGGRRRLRRAPRRDADARPTSPATRRSRARRCASPTAGATVLTNPPPSAGGTLLALALARLDGEADGRAVAGGARRRDGVRAAGARRRPSSPASPSPASLERFLAAQLGSTTHVSVLDGDGRACAVTCTNGEGSGLVVPGTGIHLNNIMGEEDLNPLGFFTAPPGRRMPSMMAPTVVLGADGEVELVLGSAGSNRIRSAILQTIVGVVDHGLDAARGRRGAAAALRGRHRLRRARARPRRRCDAAGREVAPFRGPQPLLRRRPGRRARPRQRRALRGAGDPRRGGASARA